MKDITEHLEYDEQLEELQGELPISELEKLVKAIDNASYCENGEDFVNNLDEALGYVTEMLTELRYLRKEAWQFV